MPPARPGAGHQAAADGGFPHAPGRVPGRLHRTLPEEAAQPAGHVAVGRVRLPRLRFHLPLNRLDLVGRDHAFRHLHQRQQVAHRADRRAPDAREVGLDVQRPRRGPVPPPPGRNARCISRSPCSGSGKNIKPSRQTAASNDAAGNGRAVAVPPLRRENFLRSSVGRASHDFCPAGRPANGASAGTIPAATAPRAGPRSSSASSRWATS